MTSPNGGEGGAHDDGGIASAAEDTATETAPQQGTSVTEEASVANDPDENGGDDHRNGWSTNEDFAAYISDELHLHPLSSEFPDVFAAAPGVICKWRDRFRSNAPLWRRLFKKQQVRAGVDGIGIVLSMKRLSCR